MDKLEILINRRNDAMCQLEYAHNHHEDIETIRELAYLHSRFSFDVYNYKIKHKYIDLTKIQGDYR